MEKNYFFQRVLLEPVKDFCHTKLGHLPGDFSLDGCKTEEDRSNAIYRAAIRADIGEVAKFHPKIDPCLDKFKKLLEEVTGESALEKVIAYCMQRFEIDFLKATSGITAERCYQTGRELSDEEMEQIDRKVLADYDGFFVSNRDKAVELIQARFDGLYEEVAPILDAFSKAE